MCVRTDNMLLLDVIDDDADDAKAERIDELQQHGQFHCAQFQFGDARLKALQMHEIDTIRRDICERNRHNAKAIAAKIGQKSAPTLHHPPVWSKRSSHSN